MLYYVAKVGAYNHGIFGIYDNLEEAKALADLAVNRDEDGYHEWNVLEYSPPTENTDFTVDSGHKVVYRAREIEEE